MAECHGSPTLLWRVRGWRGSWDRRWSPAILRPGAGARSAPQLRGTGRGSLLFRPGGSLNQRLPPPIVRRLLVFTDKYQPAAAQRHMAAGFPRGSSLLTRCPLYRPAVRAAAWLVGSPNHPLIPALFQDLLHWSLCGEAVWLPGLPGCCTWSVFDTWRLGSYERHVSSSGMLRVNRPRLFPPSGTTPTSCILRCGTATRMI